MLEYITTNVCIYIRTFVNKHVINNQSKHILYGFIIVSIRLDYTTIIHFFFFSFAWHKSWVMATNIYIYIRIYVNKNVIIKQSKHILYGYTQFIIIECDLVVITIKIRLYDCMHIYIYIYVRIYKQQMYIFTLEYLLTNMSLTTNQNIYYTDFLPFQSNWIIWQTIIHV